MGVCGKPECIIIDLDFGLALADLLGIPQLRHEHVDCTFLWLITGSIEDRDSKDNDFVLCARFLGNIEDGLFAF